MKSIKQMMIEARGLSHEYFRRDDDGNVTEIVNALSGVDINVKPGQFIAILGHNGCGKSTLAKHINVLLTPSDGTLYVSGMDVKDEDNTIDIRRNAGMVFQNPDNQIIASIVEEDVAFGPENIGVETDEIWKRVEKSLKSVGMLEYRDHSPNRLSGGQKQRVAIAGVMAMQPKCIILDEATAMLDPVGRKEVLSAVKELNREKHVTILWITHYMEEVTEADYIYVMDKGKIIMEGSPKGVFSQVELLREHRLSVPQITELAFELKEEGLPLPDGILTREELIEELNKCRLS
ncbi:MAG: energy-coupling factor transporter ATPase [Lachnospiraceae bacterium]|nr:energy-coupling factor transporter ATPase [Lachnospiraceae bacterium]